MTEGKPNYYAIIPADIRYDSELSDKAKLFYGEITCLANSSGVCFAGNSYFAELYGISERQVIKIIKLLEERNYICVVRESSKRIIRLAENPQRVKKSSSEGEEKFTQEGEEKFTHNNTSVNNINNNIYTADFLSWWDKYPKKVGKKSAYKNYCYWINKGYTHKDLITARDNYIKEIQSMKTELIYIKKPSNFLGRNEFFEDYISIEQKPAAKVAYVPESKLDEKTKRLVELIDDSWYK